MKNDYLERDALSWWLTVFTELMLLNTKQGAENEQLYRESVSE